LTSQEAVDPFCSSQMKLSLVEKWSLSSVLRDLYHWVANRRWPRRHWKWRRLNNWRGEDHHHVS